MLFWAWAVGQAEYFPFLFLGPHLEVLAFPDSVHLFSFSGRKQILVQGTLFNCVFILNHENVFSAMMSQCYPLREQIVYRGEFIAPQIW